MPDASLTNAVPSILNFRDIGAFINAKTGSHILKPGLLYRSARPDSASTADRHNLTSTLNICTIIDLRSQTEHDVQARKHATDKHDNDNTVLGRMSEITYYDVNLNGGAFSRALLWRLTWRSLFKLLTLMARGYRPEAVSILGKEVMQARGLEGLASDTLDFSTSEIREIFEILARERSYPLLVHCTQGKDRTGLVIILLLLLLDIPKDAITADYLASEQELVPEKEERVAELRRVGLTEDFARCPEGFVQHVTSRINEQYGGVEKHLVEACGVLPAHLDEIKRILHSQTT